MNRRIFRAFALITLALLVSIFASCASSPPPAPPDASAQKIIQLAQERYDAYDLNGAQYYYQVLLERYGSDPEYMLNAKYEMAFIEYKKGNKEKAVAGFKEILARYDAPDGQTLSQTWKVLSEKLLAKLTGGK